MVFSVPVVEFDITRLLWMYDGQELDQERVDNADLSFPVIITPWNDKFVTLDGFHRVAKAIQLGHKLSQQRSSIL